jgi:hypothetical protein
MRALVYGSTATQTLQIVWTQGGVSLDTCWCSEARRFASASRRQPIVTKSTTAAEYVGASQATDELMHFTKLLSDLGVRSRPILLRQDNRATAHSLVNPIEDGKMKYLEIHYHVVRVARHEFEVEWVN